MPLLPKSTHPGRNAELISTGQGAQQGVHSDPDGEAIPNSVLSDFFTGTPCERLFIKAEAHEEAFSHLAPPKCLTKQFKYNQHFSKFFPVQHHKVKICKY